MEPELIRAEITGRSGSLYSWEERTTNYTTGADVAPASVRKGTTSLNPAVEINGATVATGTKVWLRKRGYVGGGMRWEFQYEPAASASIGFGGVFLATPFTMTIDGAGHNVGLSIPLASAGYYYLSGRCSWNMKVSAKGGAVANSFCHLHDGSGIIEGSQNYLGSIWQLNQDHYGTSAFNCLYQALGATTVNLRAGASSADTYTTAQIVGSPGAIGCSLEFLKIA